MGGFKALAEIAPTAADTQLDPSRRAGLEGAPGGIGLEIVALADLPDAENYADHEFYYENFSASEIAYSIHRASAKASFAGLLAAKRALVKSAETIGVFEGLRRIEIAHDAEGRPTYPGCLLSISHADAIAIAVALRLNGLAPSDLSPAPEAARKRGPNLYVALVLAALLFLFGYGFWIILRFAFGKHF
jgi:phosphopantetheinyl transferase (holo-ACP synthase)